MALLLGDTRPSLCPRSPRAPLSCSLVAVTILHPHGHSSLASLPWRPGRHQLGRGRPKPAQAGLRWHTHLLGVPLACPATAPTFCPHGPSHRPPDSSSLTKPGPTLLTRACVSGHPSPDRAAVLCRNLSAPGSQRPGRSGPGAQPAEAKAPGRSSGLWLSLALRGRGSPGYNLGLAEWPGPSLWGNALWSPCPWGGCPLHRAPQPIAEP